jgi:RpiB/LacA/LacB family sugar-phosphate isomerase
VAECGFEPLDLGVNDAEKADYPVIANTLASMIAQGRIERGILICGTGIGISIAANRHRGVRAALCHDVSPQSHGSGQVDEGNRRLLSLQRNRASCRPLARSWLFTHHADRTFKGAYHESRDTQGAARQRTPRCGILRYHQEV